jgi:hypothetical protein
MPKRIDMKMYMKNAYYLRSANLKRSWWSDGVQMIHKDYSNVIEDRDH